MVLAKDYTWFYVIKKYSGDLLTLKVTEMNYSLKNSIQTMSFTNLVVDY